jgi:hypothetical protein
VEKLSLLFAKVCVRSFPIISTDLNAAQNPVFFIEMRKQIFIHFWDHWVHIIQSIA